MTRKEFEKIVTNYLNDSFNASAYITGGFENNKIIIEMGNKDDIELGTLEYISSLANTSDVKFYVDTRYAECGKYGIITIMNHSLES